MTPTKKPALHRALGISKEIEDAAWFVLGPGLLGKASPLDGRTKTWSVQAAAELLERLERGEATGRGTALASVPAAGPRGQVAEGQAGPRRRGGILAGACAGAPRRALRGHDGPRRDPGPHRGIQLDHLGPPEMALPLRAARRTAAGPRRPGRGQGSAGLPPAGRRHPG